MVSGESEEWDLPRCGVPRKAFERKWWMKRRFKDELLTRWGRESTPEGNIRWKTNAQYDAFSSLGRAIGKVTKKNEEKTGKLRGFYFRGRHFPSTNLLESIVLICKVISPSQGWEGKTQEPTHRKQRSSQARWLWSTLWRPKWSKWVSLGDLLFRDAVYPLWALQVFCAATWWDPNKCLPTSERELTTDHSKNTTKVQIGEPMSLLS